MGETLLKISTLLQLCQVHCLWIQIQSVIMSANSYSTNFVVTDFRYFGTHHEQMQILVIEPTF